MKKLKKNPETLEELITYVGKYNHRNNKNTKQFEKNFDSIYEALFSIADRIELLAEYLSIKFKKRKFPNKFKLIQK